jgi:hypothetical protein
MKTFWSSLKYFLFSYKFSFFDFQAVLWVSMLAQQRHWLWILLLIPLLIFSTAMTWRIKRDEDENA